MESKRRIAAVTMAYNEGAQLLRWANHYSRQTGGAQNVFVLDHGSTDGSTFQLPPLSVTKVERGEVGITQKARADLVSDFVGRLLVDYEFVIYTDVDELVFPDPSLFVSLYHYVSESSSPCSHAIGYDVVHDTTREMSLDERFVCEQRSLVKLVAAVCKPVLVSSPVRWSAGFHGASINPTFGELYLLHLRYADLRAGLERLSITRAIDRPDKVNVAVDHQKIADDTYRKWLSEWASAPVEGGGICYTNPIVRGIVDGFRYGEVEGGIILHDYSFRSHKSFVIDAKFRYTA